MSTTDPHTSQTSTFTILLFASASTYCGDIESLILPAPTTLRQLLQRLETDFPGIGAKVLRGCSISVNLEYVDFDYERIMSGDAGGELKIVPGDEVGIIPPVSAG